MQRNAHILTIPAFAVNTFAASAGIAFGRISKTNNNTAKVAYKYN
jgi:hypothetical protein